MARLEPEHDVTDDTPRAALLDGQPEQRLVGPRPAPLDALRDPLAHLLARQDVVAEVDDDLGQAAVGVHGVDVVERQWTEQEALGGTRPHEPREVGRRRH